VDSGITTLISLLAAALSWWLVIQIKEEVGLMKHYKNDEDDRIERIERVRLLSGKY